MLVGSQTVRIITENEKQVQMRWSQTNGIGESMT